MNNILLVLRPTVYGSTVKRTNQALKILIELEIQYPLINNPEEMKYLKLPTLHDITARGDLYKPKNIKIYKNP